MFDRLFHKPFVLARHRNGPLAEERRRYLDHCAEQQMTRRTLRDIALYTLIVAKALRIAERPTEFVTRAQIEAEAKRWFDRRPASSKMHQGRRLLKVYFTNHVVRWLTFLGRFQPAAAVRQPYADHVKRFLDSVQERGLSAQTVANYRRLIHLLLAEIKQNDFRFETLTVIQLDKLLTTKIRDEAYARTTIQRWTSVIRLFFRFAEERGWCRRGLAAAIMAPRIFTHESLPVGPSWDDVKRLLAACEGDRSADIRDRAMLTLLAVYGLRAGEVTALCLKDFDWEREVLTVPHSKSQRPRTYPLCRSVGDAILRYLREVRPRSDRREVFLTVVPPFRPLSAKSLGRVVRRRLYALDMVLPHYGPHALRHACATHLLAQGLSLKEIGDHLGHQLPETTRIYAKVDLTALRAVADLNLDGLL
jgi:integrase/recombinase XerD